MLFCCLLCALWTQNIASRNPTHGNAVMYRRTRALSPQIAALFQAGWSDTAPASVDAFYTAWCTAEFGSAHLSNHSDGTSDGAEISTAQRLVSQACEPFRMLDKQVRKPSSTLSVIEFRSITADCQQECSGNCKGLGNYPNGCGDPGDCLSMKFFDV